MAKNLLYAVLAGSMLLGGCKRHSDNYDTTIEGTIEQDAERFTMRLEEKKDWGKTSYTLYFAATGYADEEVFEFRNKGQSAFYTDNDFYGTHDGLVDRIFFPDMDISLMRSIDYENNEKVFEKADNVLQQSRERAVEILGMVPGELPLTAIRVIDSF